MKVALVHYWLVGMRGGEKVLEVLCELFPDADIYTLVADKSKLSETILKHKIYTSNLQKYGGIKHYKNVCRQSKLGQVECLSPNFHPYLDRALCLIYGLMRPSFLV